MSTLTIRLPDGKHRRLKQLAEARRVSVNKLVEELATVALVAHDAEMRFHALAAEGDPERALRLLDKLDSREKATVAAARFRLTKPGAPLTPRYGDPGFRSRAAQPRKGVCSPGR